ncbi:MAG: DUF1080 domain-containing protein [Kiritimatiellae bacterium]|jgi:hypothetical protein|nr:DUF1080 domain-containing protein [Kiritimatiellia bacterium]
MKVPGPFTVHCIVEKPAWLHCEELWRRLLPFSDIVAAVEKVRKYLERKLNCRIWNYDPSCALNPAGQWNASRLLIQGNHVEHWLNGSKVLEYELGSAAVKAGVAESKYKDFPTYGIKISGHIMLTDHNDEAWYRLVKIRELK